jgi:transposase
VKCLDHGRRNFKDIEESFPIECGHVIRELGQVYHHDAICKEKGMTSELRLSFHQEYSAPIMDELKLWMEQLIEAKQVEPNGKLGGAFRYMLKHWPGLTQFLRLVGAPLSNGPVERLLKTLVIRRKNSLIHRTEVGAWVADILMSIIQTTIAAKANPFEYLTALQIHRKAVREAPERWLPWNYLENLKTSAVPA